MPFRPLTGNIYSAVTVGMMLVSQCMTLVYGQEPVNDEIWMLLYQQCIITVLTSAAREGVLDIH